MEPKAGLNLSQMWINAEADITQKASRSNEIQDSDLRRVASAITSVPAPQMADSPFLKAQTNKKQTQPTKPKARTKKAKWKVIGGPVQRLMMRVRW